jgi:hypothetical protein
MRTNAFPAHATQGIEPRGAVPCESIEGLPNSGDSLIHLSRLHLSSEKTTLTDVSTSIGSLLSMYGL